MALIANSMYNKIYYILIFLVVSIAFCDNRAYAQEANLKWAIKPSYSLLQYNGELGSQFFHFDERNDGCGLALSRYINPSVDIVMGLDYYRLNLNGRIDSLEISIAGNIFSPGFSVNYKFNRKIRR